MNDKKLGFALCGSFCTLERPLRMMAELVSAGWEIQPIMSPITYGTDTRFGTAEHWRDQVEALCGRPIWHTVAQVEPIGPRKLLDILLVAPCTGNTLGKLAGGITDTPVTMAVKAHLRNDRVVSIFHHRMYYTLAVHHHPDLLRCHSEEHHRLNDLKPLVHKGRGIDGNAVSHAPCRVGKRVGGSYPRKLLPLLPEKRPAGAGQQDTPHLTPVPAALQALKHRTVLTVHRHDLRAVFLLSLIHI